jgi:hypothetical protein
MPTTSAHRTSENFQVAGIVEVERMSFVQNAGTSV